MRSLETTDGPMDVFVAEPGGAARGGVVVIQEAFGLTTHIQSICTRLADAGWMAVAPALFHRTGSPVLGYDDLGAVAPHFLAITADGLEMDLAAALGLLGDAGVPSHQRGVVGFCMGGTIALWAGTHFELGAAVTFYGSGIEQGRFGLAPLRELAPSLGCAWQGHFGDLDTGIPVEQVEALRQAAETAPVDTELYRYAEAAHGFNCNERDAFEPASAALAWRRTLEWFDAHLAPVTP